MRAVHQVRRLARAAVVGSFFVSRLKRQAGRGVLLTFDDGPHSETTPAVLKLLEEHGARAVFFVPGKRVDRAPDLLSKTLSLGHILGNHSYEHPLGRQPGLRRYIDDLRRCQKKIQSVTGVEPTLHRPPLGTISPASAFGPRLLGMKSVLWTRSSEDWQFRSTSEARSEAARMLPLVRARDILLFHDERPYVLAALEILLPGLQAEGFDLAPRIESLL